MNVDKLVEKYKNIAQKHGLNLSDADIMYLQAFIRTLVRQELEKVTKL